MKLIQAGGLPDWLAGLNEYQANQVLMVLSLLYGPQAPQRWPRPPTPILVDEMSVPDGVHVADVAAIPDVTYVPKASFNQSPAMLSRRPEPGDHSHVLILAATFLPSFTPAVAVQHGPGPATEPNFCHGKRMKRWRWRRRGARLLHAAAPHPEEAPRLRMVLGPLQGEPELRPILGALTHDFRGNPGMDASTSVTSPASAAGATATRVPQSRQGEAPRRGDASPSTPLAATS